MESRRSKNIVLFSMFLFCPLAISLYFATSSLVAPYLLAFASLLMVLAGWSHQRKSDSVTMLSVLSISVGGLFFLLYLTRVIARLYVQSTNYNTDVFRLVWNRFTQFPLYGVANPASLTDSLLAILVTLVIITLLLRYKNRIILHKYFWVSVLIAQASLMYSYAITDGIERFTLYNGHYMPFINDIGFFNSIPELLSEYTAKLPLLEFTNKHYPPGFMLMILIEQKVGIPGLLKWLTYSSSLAIPHIARKFSEEMGLSKKASQWVLVLSATSAGLLIFPSTSPMPIIVLLGLLSQRWLFISLRTGSPIKAALGGLTLAVLALFSFIISIIGLIIVIGTLTGLIIRQYNLTKTLIVSTSSITVFLLFYILLFKFTGFDIVANFKASIGNNQLGMSKPYDSLIRWSIRIPVNITAYFASLGPALAALSLYSIYKFKEHEVTFRIYLVAVVGALFIASVSGLFHGETERVWLIFTPGLALLAGAIIDTPSGKYLDTGLPLAISWTLIFSLLYEILFMHHL